MLFVSKAGIYITYMQLSLSGIRFHGTESHSICIPVRGKTNLCMLCELRFPLVFVAVADRRC